MENCFFIISARLNSQKLKDSEIEEWLVRMTELTNVKTDLCVRERSISTFINDWKFLTNCFAGQRKKLT